MTDRRQRPRRRLATLLPLLALVSASSALNLSQFQIITSNQIPRRCIHAYRSEIPGCTRVDFTNGRQCSDSCAQGLQDTAEKIDRACEDVSVNAESLLGIVLSGGLLDALCPGFGATTVTTTIHHHGTTKGFTTVPVSTTTKETPKMPPPPPPSPPPSPPHKPPPDTTKSTTTQLTTTEPTSQETTSASATRDPPGASPTSSSAEATSVQTTATSDAAQTSNDSQPANSTPFGGGGSPFDPVPFESLSTTICLGRDLSVWMASILAAIFLIR
ncbi:hypothetical protein GGR52DRAFT_10405 [Hypoxylon sp. FL1284]|nr:hypothetical protein GGR52DRAFT_10405 [Hypoxylon sp. FL1284]